MGKLRRFALPALASESDRPGVAAADPEGPEYTLIKRYLEEGDVFQVNLDREPVTDDDLEPIRELKGSQSYSSGAPKSQTLAWSTSRNCTNSNGLPLMARK